MARHWWRGWERTDPEGYPVRIGAFWTRFLLHPRYAIVIRSTIWIRRPITYRRYAKSRWWRAHEHHHFWQEREYFRCRTLPYLWAFIWQYARHRSHGGAPLEQEANAYADAVVKGDRDPYPPENARGCR